MFGLMALALMLVAYLYSGVQVTGIFQALVAALVLGLVNALIRPILARSRPSVARGWIAGQQTRVRDPSRRGSRR